RAWPRGTGTTAYGSSRWRRSAPLPGPRGPPPTSAREPATATTTPARLRRRRRAIRAPGCNDCRERARRRATTICEPDTCALRNSDRVLSRLDHHLCLYHHGAQLARLGPDVRLPHHGRLAAMKRRALSRNAGADGNR